MLLKVFDDKNVFDILYHKRFLSLHLFKITDLFVFVGTSWMMMNFVFYGFCVGYFVWYFGMCAGKRRGRCFFAVVF